MVAWTAVTRQHVLAAIHEYDEIGQDEFLSRYGFAPSTDYVLRHGNNSYDSKAIVGAALGYATGTPATSTEFSGGKTGAAKVLLHRARLRLREALVLELSLRARVSACETFAELREAEPTKAGAHVRGCEVCQGAAEHELSLYDLPSAKRS